MDAESLSQLLGIPRGDHWENKHDFELQHEENNQNLEDSESSVSSTCSDTEEILQSPWQQDGTSDAEHAFTHKTNGKRCWWHFERHFDYMIDRKLRPIEEYIISRGPGIRDLEKKVTYTVNDDYTDDYESLGSSYGCSSISIHDAITTLIDTYKQGWKSIFNGFDCLDHQRVNQFQNSIDQDFQNLVESSNIVETPRARKLFDDTTNVASSHMPVSMDDQQKQSKVVFTRTQSSQRFASNAFVPTPQMPSNTYTGQSFNNNGSVGQSNIIPQTTDTSAKMNSQLCPGYSRNSADFFRILETKGCKSFYDLLDRLFVGLEGCRIGSRYVQTIDLLSVILQLMPELICLLIGPSINKRDASGRRYCYFKRFVILIRSYLKYLGIESFLTILEMFKDATSGRYTPFYLITGEKEIATKHIKASMASIILFRLLMLSKQISEKCRQWIFLDFHNCDFKNKLIQRLKRFVYLPLFSMKLVHEILVPLSGQLFCSQACLMNFNYLKWVRWYLYPSPPLYLLRSTLLDLVHMAVVTTQLNLVGWSSRLKKNLTEYAPVKIGSNYEMKLRLMVYLLVYQASYILAPEYLSTCVNNPQYFFGSYYLMLPHVQYGLSKVVQDALMEKKIYPLQEKVVDLLKVTLDEYLLSRDLILDFHGSSLTQSNIFKRVLALAWHYNTAPRISDGECGISISPTIETKLQMDDNRCHGECHNVAPYSASNCIDFLKNNTLSTVFFRQNAAAMQPVKCIFTTADEIESKVRRNEDFINHSRVAENEFVVVRGCILDQAPIEMVFSNEARPTARGYESMESDTHSVKSVQKHAMRNKHCSLGCLLNRHAPVQTDLNVDELRWSVVLQCVGLLSRYLGDDPDTLKMKNVDYNDTIGLLLPIWRALVENLCCNEVKDRQPCHKDTIAWGSRKATPSTKLRQK
ncbi:uncharacterized protein BBOV_IV010970 [Babesia bovis T2Bo]|uniref:Uncharacterized protein n=1 Tax=Babesia bovis TaxID=5865 RepID=A7ASD1_BABBO|nr:uncharacterized protein BBOV_IV010970 [Babesia bovis T2Bo]EDO07450.1 hypothetical protein BBOV_IV010970 [Babesia bovis T2Bo]|eukprot:XP_001611018.1 hypothetical protein [Babesia bovis T2Bo]